MGRGVVVAAVAAVLSVAGGASATRRAEPATTIYRYVLTFAGTGSGSDFVSTVPSVYTASGTLGASFSVGYHVQLTVDNDSKTVCVGPWTTAPPGGSLGGYGDPCRGWVRPASASGSASMNLSVNCITCQAPPDQCSYTNVDLAPLLAPILHPADGAGWQNDETNQLYLFQGGQYPDFAGTVPLSAGQLRFYQHGGGMPSVQPRYPCAGGYGPEYAWPFGQNVPGFLDECGGSFTIPLNDVGKPKVVLPYSFDGTCHDGGAAIPVSPGPDYHGTAQLSVTLELVSSGPHIGEATANLSEGLAREVRTLRPQAASLVGEKNTLLGDLKGLNQRVEQADATLARLAAKIPALTQQVARTQALAAQALAAQGESASAALAAQRDSLDREMNGLQGQILDAIGNLSPDAVVDALIAHYNADQSKLTDLEHTLAGKEPKADAIDRSWIAKLRDVEQQLVAAQREQARADTQRWVAVDELNYRHKRIDEIDAQLAGLAAKAASLDLGLRTVTVTADGKTVFQAEFNRDLPGLTALDAQIDEARQHLGLLYEKRVDARMKFLAAEQEATQALDNVWFTVLVTAGKKAGVDFAYNAYDVIMAGRKGGLLGAFAETLKKAGETVVKEGPPWNWFSAHLSSGGATELDSFDKEYDTLFTPLITGGTAVDISEERLAKQALGKTAKDYFNQKRMAPLFVKWWGIPLKAGERAAPENLTQTFKEFIASFSNAESHLNSLKTGPKLNPLSGIKSVSDLKGILDSPIGDLVGNYLKDVSKQLMKGALDLPQQKAFADYFVKETVARAYFPLWALADQRYWQEEDNLQDLLDKKAAVIAKGYNAETQVRTTLDETFPKTARLVIEVNATGSGLKKGEVQLEAKVHGKAAAHAGTLRFTIPAAGLGVSEDALGLELVAH